MIPASPRLLRSVVLSGLAALGSTAACAGELALDARPCPCADDFFCCPATNTCIAAGDTCGGASSVPRADDGQTTTVYTFADQQTSPRCLAQDNEHLFMFSENGRLEVWDKRTRTLRPSRYPIPPQTMAVSDRGPVCTIALDGGSAYVTLYGSGKIARVDARTTEDGTFELGPGGALLGELVTPTSVALDERFLYVTEYDSGRIVKVPRNGTSGGEPIANGAQHPHEILLVGDDLGWIDDGGVRTMAKTGGAIVTLSTDPYGRDLVAHDGRLFWNGVGGVFSTGQGGGPASRISWISPMVICKSPAWAEIAPATGAASLTERGGDLFFASSVRFHRWSTRGGEVVDLTDYRDACGERSSARLLIVDDARIYWVDDQAIRSRPR